MLAEIKEPNLEEIFYSEMEKYLYNPSKPMSTKPMTEAMSTYLDLMHKTKEVIDKGDKLDNMEYASMIASIFTYYFDAVDYLKIFSLRTGKHFKEYRLIKTKMLLNVAVRRDGTDTFDMVEAIVGFNVAYSEESKLKPGHHYSKEELKKLMASGDIVLLSEQYFEPDNSHFKVDDYENFPITEVYNITKYDSPYYMTTIEYMRQNISKVFLTKGLNTFGNNIVSSIEEIKNNPNHIFFEEKYADACLEAMEEKGQIRKLTRFISKKN